MIGFNTLDKPQDWNGRIVNEDILKVEKDGMLICFDGSPVVEDQQLAMFDYGSVHSGQEYSIDVTEGVLGLFTKC